MPLHRRHSTSLARPVVHAEIVGQGDATTLDGPPSSQTYPQWLGVKVPTSLDIRRLRPSSLPRGERFETVNDAKKIDEANMARLMSRPDLAAGIERYEADGPAGTTPITALAARRYRIYDTSERLRIAGEYEGPHEVATIYLGAFAAGQLHTVDVNLAHGSLRKKLHRSEFAGSILTGGTEVAWLERTQRWILHVHLLAIGVLEEDWVRLRESLPAADPAIALKVQPLVDLAEQLSYCQKFNSSHKPGKRGPNGKAPMYPLPPARLIEWAEFMSRHGFEDFGFHFGARRRGRHIVPDA